MSVRRVAILLVALLASCTTPPAPVPTSELWCSDVAEQVRELTPAIIEPLRAGDEDAVVDLVHAKGRPGACAWAVVYGQIAAGLSLSDRPREEVPAEVARRAEAIRARLAGDGGTSP
jgi:hypothetical protein